MRNGQQKGVHIEHGKLTWYTHTDTHKNTKNILHVGAIIMNHSTAIYNNYVTYLANKLSFNFTLKAVSFVEDVKSGFRLFQIRGPLWRIESITHDLLLASKFNEISMRT